jgi:hypothetical protein
MALTAPQEAKVVQMIDAFDNGKKISELPVVEAGEVEQGVIEVETPAGISKKVSIIQAIHSKQFACRRWNETLSTPTGEAWGNIDFLRALPSILGLGAYLVADDRSKRKLDPTNHYRFADGSPAALDGSMGQYMWCWAAHWFCTKKEGNYLYEAVTLEKLSGWECTYVPAGGTSALGFGVMDRTNAKLCSVINTTPQFRGGNNNANYDGTYRSMLGMPATYISPTTTSVNARKRGTGWEANWYVSKAVQEYLFRIIMGTRHSQAAFNPEKDASGLFQGGLGSGVTGFNNTVWNEKFGYYPIVPCGAGVELGDGVGVFNYDVKDEDGTVLYTAPVPVFFGLKHLYGHLWTVLRGLITNVEQGDSGKTLTYVARSLYDYTPTDDNTIDGMILASEQPRVEGWIKKQSMHKLCCMPTEVGGGSGTYFCDYFWTNVVAYYGLRSRLAGGRADTGTYAGAFCANSNAAVAWSDAYGSLPLCFFEEDPIMQ